MLILPKLSNLPAREGIISLFPLHHPHPDLSTATLNHSDVSLPPASFSYWAPHCFIILSFFFHPELGNLTNSCWVEGRKTKGCSMGWSKGGELGNNTGGEWREGGRMGTQVWVCANRVVGRTRKISWVTEMSNFRLSNKKRSFCVKLENEAFSLIISTSSLWTISSYLYLDKLPS